MVHGYEYGRNHRRCDVWWWRRPEGSWPMARIRSEQQAMGQVNVIDGRWVGGRQYSTAGGLVVWCCGRGEVDECGRHGWMRLPCCLLGEEAVGVLCRYRSTYPTNSYVRTWPFLSSKIFINTNSTDGFEIVWYPNYYGLELELGQLNSDPNNHIDKSFSVVISLFLDRYEVMLILRKTEFSPRDWIRSRGLLTDWWIKIARDMKVSSGKCAWRYVLPFCWIAPIQWISKSTWEKY